MKEFHTPPEALHFFASTNSLGAIAEMRQKMIKDILGRTFKKIIDPFYAGGAAEVAFFLMLSLVPTTIILSQILDVFTLSMSAITNLVSEYLDADVAAIIMPLLGYRPSNTLSIMLFIIALWAGSKALFSLMRMSNYAYKGGTGYKNPIFAYIRERFRALITTVIILLTFVFALFVLVFGEEIIDVVLRYINGFLGNEQDFNNVWYTLRWIIAFFLYFFMVVTIYYIMPSKRSSFTKLIGRNVFRTALNIITSWWSNFRKTIKLILPGGLFASLGMLFTTWLYSFYIDWVSSDARNFNIIYGGLSSIVLLLIWFYVLSYVLIIGVQLNAAWIETIEDRQNAKRIKQQREYYENRDRKKSAKSASNDDSDDELPLVFGTAGMRGIMGLGRNKFNVVTVRRASQAFAEHILSVAFENSISDPSIVIAYDSRRDSDLFAYEAASVFAANKVKASVFRDLSATPLLSFAVREMGASAGLVITASHNGKEYNGYKIYNCTGAQCLPDEASKIAELMDNVDLNSEIKTIAEDYEGSVQQRLRMAATNETYFEIVPDYIEERYIEAVYSSSLLQKSDEIKKLSIVYTPLNGAGNLPVRKVLKKLGSLSVTVVKDQESPDPDFTTCPEPNPENPQALALGLEICEKKKSEGKPPDLLVATDPDSDRLGIAAYDGESFVILTGNQVGVLMLDYLIERKKSKGISLENKVFITSIVSTPLATRIAEQNGLEVQRVLTGFKNIGAAMNKLQENDRIDDFLFAYEESCGYLSGAHVRDKDAVEGAMLICELAAHYKSQGKTLIGRLCDITDAYGYVAEDSEQFIHPGAQGMREMKEMMRRARSNEMKKALGLEFCFKDYQDEDDFLKSDVVEYDFTNGAKVLLRPSGTEPKIKAYFFGLGTSKSESSEVLNSVKSKFTSCFRE